MSTRHSSVDGAARVSALPIRQAWRARRMGAASPAALVVLLAALALSVAPGFYMLSVSFMDNPQLFAGRVLAWPLRPENYPRAWVASDIGRLYWNSIVVSTVSMVVTVAISALAGYGLGRIRFAGRGVIYALVLVGLTIPLQIALIPLFINLRSLGLLNTWMALIGPYTGFGLAFGTYIMKGFFEGLPRELEEAARLDGAERVRDLRPGHAAPDPAGAGHRGHLPLPPELERVPLRADLHHRGPDADAPHRHLRAALQRVLRQLPHPRRLPGAVLDPRPGALLPVPAEFIEGITAGALKN